MFCYYSVFKLLASIIDGLLGILERLGVTGWVLFWLLCAVLYRGSIASLISRLEGMIQRVKAISFKDVTAKMREDHNAHTAATRENILRGTARESKIDETPPVIDIEVRPEVASSKTFSSGGKLSPYECYWLGHDLAWTQMVLLTMGSSTDINFGLRQSLSHLSAVVGQAHPLYSNLHSVVDSCTSYEDADWSEAVRISVFSQLQVLKNELGGVVDYLHNQMN